MSSDSLRVIATVADQDEFLNQIDVLRDSLYNKDIDVNMRLKKIRIDFASAIEPEVENAVDKAKVLDDLRLAVKNMRVINMRVGFNYNQDFVRQLADWVKDNVGEDVVLEVEVNYVLIGGATISFDGKYRDYSVRSALDKVWKN